ncbi:MAG: mechanosensitive ion channel family protein [Planctomycetota bacterium]|nr:mechanosensitive ion channel family protein [Planctomycetota bacterium]
MRFNLFQILLLILVSGAEFHRGTIGAAEENATVKTEEPKDAVDPSLKVKLSSPRETLKTFFNAFKPGGNPENAALTLNLSEKPLNIRSTVGIHDAYQLKDVIDRMVYVQYYQVPDDSESKTPFRLSQITTKLTGADEDDAALIEIAPDETGYWRFTDDTVSVIGDLYQRWKDRPTIGPGIIPTDAPIWTPTGFEKLFPHQLTNQHFLLADYQWLCLFALIFIGFILDRVTRLLLSRLVRGWLRFFDKDNETTIEVKIFRPMGLLVQGYVWYEGTKLLGLPDFALSLLLIALQIFTVIAAIWTCFLLIDVGRHYLFRKARKTPSKFDDLLVQLLSKSLKVFFVCVGVLTAAQAFGLPIAGLLGGMGIGGAAIALASKDTFSNIFGSFTVLADRPFEVGDWVITNHVEGTVEAVGFRSTRIRTFYNSLITLPNSLLTTTSVDNMGARRYRRINTSLGVQYNTTPEQIDAFCEGIRELIRRHPYTRKDYYHVYFNQFSDSSLNILLYCFLECPDWAIELRERHRLFNDILRLAQKLKVDFAFPTRTLHMFNHGNDPLPEEPKLPDPTESGQRIGAQIAGPLQGVQDRPGPVSFSGPSSF